MYVDMGTAICQVPVQLLVYLYSFSSIVSGQVLGMEMRPDDDQFLLTGSSLHLNCSLIIKDSINWESDMNVYNATDIKIYKSNSNAKFSSEMFTYYQNELTLEMSIENVSIDNSGIYTCVYIPDKSVYTLIKINVGEPPGEPYNLTCISYNYLNLTCSGILAKPKTNLDMEWKMQYRKASLCQVDWNNISWSLIPETRCQRVNGVHVYCSWYSVYEQSNNMTFSKMECHQIRIGVRTKYGVKWSMHLKFMPSEKVKPDPVRFLAYKYDQTQKSTSMEIRWLPPEIPTTIIHLKYRLQINSEENWDEKNLIYNTNSSGTIAYTLTDLIPYVDYTVTVYALPVVTNDTLYWSQGSSITFKTPDDVPGMPPNLTMGSFTISDYSDVNMCLVLYWKNPLRKFRNGICSYKVRVDPDMIEVTNISYRVYYKLDQRLTKADNHNVTLWLMTRKGFSANSTKLVVPSWRTAITTKPMWVIVELDEYVANVSWAVDMKICARITSVTYYWCTGNLTDFNNTLFSSCQDNLDWYTVNETKGCKQSSWVSKPGDQSSIRYAVSITVDDVSGGMVWERYRFTNTNAAPIKPLYGVISLLPGQLQVTVVFELHYVSTGGRPDIYQIQYGTLTTSAQETKHCPKDHKIKSFQANFSNPVMILNDLAPNTKYVVCVMAINSAGQGQIGDPKIGVTFGTKGSLIVGIAVPTVLSLIILVAVVCFLKSALRDRISKISNIRLPSAFDTECRTVHYNLIEANTVYLEGFQKMNPDAFRYKKSSPSSIAESQPVDQQDKTTHNPEMVLSRSDKSCICNGINFFDTVRPTSWENNIVSDNSHNVSNTFSVPSKGNNHGRVTSERENCCLVYSRDTFDPESVTVKSNPCEWNNSRNVRVNWRDNEKCKDKDYFKECQVSTEQDSYSKMSKVRNTGEINNNTNNGEKMSNESMEKRGAVAKLENQSSREIMSDYVTAAKF